MPVSKCVKYPQVIKNRYEASCERWKDDNQAAAAPPDNLGGEGNKVADLSKIEVNFEDECRSVPRSLLSPLTTYEDTLKLNGPTLG